MTQQIQVQRTINVATSPVESARAYSRDKFKQYKADLRAVLPHFTRNYLLMQQYLQKYALDIPRNEMPVIEPNDMSEFERRLEEGRIDIFKPYARKSNLFPSKFRDKSHQDRWLEHGKKDGNEWDDSIPVVIQRISANRLKPLQSQVWLNLLIKYIIQYGVPHPASPAVNTTIIVSKEYYILDGHHRWGQVMLADPNLVMKCLYVPFGVEDLLKIGKSYGTAIGNTPNQ